jgi:hypothetical protein
VETKLAQIPHLPVSKSQLRQNRQRVKLEGLSALQEGHRSVDEVVSVEAGLDPGILALMESSICVVDL